MDSQSDLPLDPVPGQPPQEPVMPDPIRPEATVMEPSVTEPSVTEATVTEPPVPAAPADLSPAPADLAAVPGAVVGRVAAAPAEPTLEPLEAGEAVGAATQPVGPRTSRRRWAIALGVVVAVVALSIAAAFTLSSAGQTSLTARAVPKTSLMFATLRTDMPGDQQQKVAELLAHFPGFADQSLLQQSLGETLDKLFRGASNGKHDYTNEIKPWLGGEVAIAITRAPTANDPNSGGYLFLAQVKDAAKAEAWLRGGLSGSGAAAEPDETYDGVTLHRYQETVGGQSTVQHGAEAISGQLLLFGDVVSVKASLDAKQHGSLDGSDQYKTASKSIGGDHLATFYIDVKGFMRAAMAEAATASPLASQIPSSLLAKLPAWAWMTVRAESNALVTDVAMPSVAGSASAADRVSVLAPKLPSTTLGVFEIHDLGTTVKAMLDQLSSEPTTKDAANQVRTGLAFLGGVDHFLGWMGDAAAVVTRDGSSFGGGLVLQAKDATAGADFISQLKSLFVLGGSSTGVTTQDETYEGTTITTIDLSELISSQLGGQAGAQPAATKARVALAAKGDLVILGVGDTFVKAVLDTKAGASLADSAAYRDALASAGASNGGQSYVDIGAILAAVEPLLPADQRAKFDADYRPYLDHLAALASTKHSGNVQTSRMVVTIK